jgi:hypothetical protein
MAGNARNLWTMPLSGMIAWEIVDEFLRDRQPEGPRLEYREKFDPGPRGRERFADTVGAMANGSGGLILLGVRANAQDIPVSWPCLAVDDLRSQTLHSSVRGFVEPYVPIEVAIARKPADTPDDHGGDVVVARVPSLVHGPVFVANRGVLVREGEANVPASVAQLAAWFGERSAETQQIEGQLFKWAGSLFNVPKPQLNVAVGPSDPWGQADWGDVVDVTLAEHVRRLFPDVEGPLVSEDLLQFRREDPPNHQARAVIFQPSGVTVRQCELAADPDGRVAALMIAGQILRTWRLARSCVPIILPGYSGRLSIVISTGGMRPGFRSDRPMTVRLQDRPIRPEHASDGWRCSHIAVAADADEFELIASTMRRMLRNYGYTPTEAAAQELAFFSAFKDADLPPLAADMSQP